MPSANFSSELAKVKATGQPFVDRLFSADPQVQWESVNDMRNLTAGNRRQENERAAMARAGEKAKRGEVRFGRHKPFRRHFCSRMQPLI